MGLQAKGGFFGVVLAAVLALFPMVALGAGQTANPKTPVQAEAPAGLPSGELVKVDKGLYIFDDKSRDALEQRLSQINEKYDIHAGVMILKKLPSGKTAEQMAKSIVEGKNGFEKGSNGSILFLVAVDSRDYYIATGRYLNRIITTEGGIPYLQSEILPSLKENNFAGAADYFVDATEMELAYYQEKGEPYDPANEFSVLALIIALLGSGLIAIGIRSHLIAKMSNVEYASDADVYLERDSVQFTEREDTYLYTNVTVMPRARSSGGSSGSSGGGSTGGGGGKF